MHSSAAILCHAPLAFLSCFAESVCCKRMFRVFWMFQMYVASVLNGCCKNRSGYCICCNGCTRILQRSVTNILSMFSGRILQMCLSECCICFTHTLHVCLFGCCVWLQWFPSVFRCFFQVFQKHVSIVSTVFKHMLQLLYLDVLKVDRVLYLSSPHLLLHHLRASIRRRGWVLPNRRR